MKKYKVETFGLFAVVLVAVLNHVFTYLVYEWYPGMDAYSYDVCGLQLMTGQIFDPYAVMYRPPLVPIAKNILYMIFERRPYILALVIHLIGVLTVFLSYRLGKRFNSIVGFILGLLVAINLNISIFFHSISAFTFYVPLLILAADYFICWVKDVNFKSLGGLIITTFLLTLTRTEALILIPIFFFFGLLGHKSFKHAGIF
ncbi:MAG: glycosyltransferase family 39 protein, partial [Candidatus Omnitrophica bacterium]|nr:glycosyltransferase family 39 protein [Candidatus Omnitrophota bacterium]